MTDFADIVNSNWQLSTVGPGYVAQGVQDIGQCILFAVSTQKGSDPLRPQFGCDIFDFIDRPLPVAGPSMVRAIIDAVNLWEPRIELKGVQYSYEDDNREQKNFPTGIRFEIGWKLIGGDVYGQTNLFVGTGDNVGPVPLSFYILATENNDSILTEDGFEIRI